MYGNGVGIGLMKDIMGNAMSKVGLEIQRGQLGVHFVFCVVAHGAMLHKIAAVEAVSLVILGSTAMLAVFEWCYLSSLYGGNRLIYMFVQRKINR